MTLYVTPLVSLRAAPITPLPGHPLAFIQRHDLAGKSFARIAFSFHEGWAK